MTFEEVKADYLKLIDEYGVPEDMTGGFVDAERMEVVIRNPTKTNAKKYMLDVISYGFQYGNFWRTEFNGDITIESDKWLQDVHDIYC